MLKIIVYILVQNQVQKRVNVVQHNLHVKPRHADFVHFLFVGLRQPLSMNVKEIGRKKQSERKEKPQKCTMKGRLGCDYWVCGWGVCCVRVCVIKAEGRQSRERGAETMEMGF